MKYWRYSVMVQADIDEEAFAAADDDDGPAIENTIFILEQKKVWWECVEASYGIFIEFHGSVPFSLLLDPKESKICTKSEDIFQIQGGKLVGCWDDGEKGSSQWTQKSKDFMISQTKM